VRFVLYCFSLLLLIYSCSNPTAGGGGHDIDCIAVRGRAVFENNIPASQVIVRLREQEYLPPVYGSKRDTSWKIDTLTTDSGLFELNVPLGRKYAVEIKAPVENYGAFIRFDVPQYIDMQDTIHL